MKLIPVDKNKDAVKHLFALLLERKSHESISHQSMPTFEDHRKFVESHPYLEWYLIVVDSVMVGAVYITKQRELGIGIFESYRRLGYAKEALKIIMHKHPGRCLANINPNNDKSVRLFGKLGFKMIQHTYEYRP